MTTQDMFDKIRKLDMDDIVLLTLMLEDCKCSEISKILYLTPPAISHRLNKYISLFGDGFFEIKDRKKVLSLQGKEFAEKAKIVLGIFLPLGDTVKGSLIKPDYN